MGFFGRLLEKGDEVLDTITRRTITFLKAMERKDRRALITDNNLEYEKEVLFNKLEFSRKSCVVKYIQRLAKGRDVGPELITQLA